VSGADATFHGLSAGLFMLIIRDRVPPNQLCPVVKTHLLPGLAAFNARRSHAQAHGILVMFLIVAAWERKPFANYLGIPIGLRALGRRSAGLIRYDLSCTRPAK
jgi:hypothetical protein